MTSRSRKMQSVKQQSGFEQLSSSCKSVLGIVGSPRRGANTETLVDSVLAGAEKCGATTTKVILPELNIQPCQACNKCQREGSCIHEDDMESILQLMEKSDIWVLGTPIYWWGPSAQFKVFIDRWYGVDQRIFQGKQVILTIPMGGNNEHYARHTIGMFKDICNYLGMICVEAVVAPRMTGRNSAQENTRLLDAAKEAVSSILEQE
ncbi:flavodoxin family protein [Candidatus Thorarchaeota archaeon]|nr:MAG: flavodoxin family protein [Candidatus Thorarchaeota archaeon]